ncbi:SH3 domain-containing protein [Xylanimonas ulmi]|uniref:SH3 domain-containing protein n=1 Tax=Xylanimonas ulmi TaxID=228973 RepID=A0A4V2EXK8_9MICO|nr:SH3 domain-containing protein [Xylanibacterium ulmi]RZS59840.1 SH3 domain-containing protein [Xylanibacterium ulmi]
MRSLAHSAATVLTAIGVSGALCAATAVSPPTPAAAPPSVTFSAADRARLERERAEAQCAAVAQAIAAQEAAAREAAREAAALAAAESAAAEEAAASQAAEQAAAEAAAAQQAAAAERAAAEAAQEQATPAQAVAAVDVAVEDIAVESIAARDLWTTTTLNVRAGPGTGHAKVGVLRAGARVTVNGRGGSFYRLLDGGFVSGAYLTSVEPATREAPEPPPATEQRPGHDAQPAPIAWRTWLANSADGVAQAAIDACTGGLTQVRGVGDYLGVTYLAIHRHCGGKPVLALRVGDLVEIQGLGVYRVVSSRDVAAGLENGADQVIGLSGSVMIQSCYANGSMRVVGLVAA